MYLTRLAILSQVLGAALAGSNCDNGNNCQRALLKTIAGKQNPLADCNSYLQVTVTPKTVTVTAGATSTAIATSTETDVSSTTTTLTVIAPGKRSQPGQNLVEIRQVTVSASSIPAYASACSGAVKYSSACSCIGATQSTVTVTAPSTTTTASTTLSTTVTTTTSTVAIATATQHACPDGSIYLNGACSRPGCSLYAQCPGTSSGAPCACYPEVADESIMFCIDLTNNGGCESYPSCVTQADCTTPGDVCIDGGADYCHVCIPAASQVCANTGSPSRLFRVKRTEEKGPLLAGNGQKSA